MESQKKKKYTIRFIVIVYIAVLAVLLAAVYTLPKLSGAMEQTMTIENGVLESSSDVTCYIIKDEVVYYSGSDGSVGYYYDEGTGLRSGTSAVSIDTAGEPASDSDYDNYRSQALAVEDPSAVLTTNSSEETLTAELREQAASEDDVRISTKINNALYQISNMSGSTETPSDDGSSIPVSPLGVTYNGAITNSGSISYYLDGYETVFNEYTMKLLDHEKLEKLDFETSNLCTGSTKAGAPLFKIVDGRKWFAVCWIDPGELGKYDVGCDISMELPKSEVTGTVTDMLDMGDEIMLVMEFDAYYEDIGSIRCVDTTITSSRSGGLLVDNSYITTVDGVTGVYVVDVTGETEFKEVKILAADEEYSLVAEDSFTVTEGEETRTVSTVSVYDEIKKP